MPHWSKYPSAPAIGTIVGNIDQLSVGANTLLLETAQGSFPLIVVLKDKHVTAFVNACPHQFLPLDYRGNNIMSDDGNRLICSAHGAMFDSCSGEGLNEVVEGCHLDIVPLSVDNSGSIQIAVD